MSTTQHLRDILDANPEIKYNDAKELIKNKWELDLSRSNYDKIKSVRRKGKRSKKKKIIKKVQGHSSPPRTDDYIDDPDELLMSVSTRELNKPDPDPRWASILISVRKENIGKSKREGKIRSKFKSMNIKDIAKILSEKQNDISLKPDLKESS